LLLFCVLAIGYLTNQTGLATRFFQSLYWSYTVSLAFGLMLGLILPGRFPLWSVDDFTGRTRLSVYATFPGTMGETAAYLVLLSPIIFRRSHWLSRLFLVLMNFAAGGKTSTAVLLLLLAVEYISQIRSVRSWRVVALVGGSCLAVPVMLWVTLGIHAGAQLLSRVTDMVYGHDIAAEAVSLDGRLALWKSSFGLLLDSPLLGYGFDGARETLIRVAEWSGSSHNAFLELGLAAGLSGLGIFLIGLAGVLRACWGSGPELRRRAFLVLAYMLSIAFTGITFNFPSYFGLLILTLLLYRSSKPADVLSSATATSWPNTPALAGHEEHACRA
jgi:O-antigen ligase